MAGGRSALRLSSTGHPELADRVLQGTVKVTGRIVAHLFAATTGTDSDWIAKLIDVYPETNEKEPDMGGFQLMIADEVMRGRFRE